MRILVLDDSTERLDHFRRWYGAKHNLRCVETAEEATGELRNLR